MTKLETLKNDPRPQSAVSSAVGIVGVLGLITWLMIARNFGAIAATLGYPGFPDKAEGPYSALVCLVFCGMPMVLWSVLVDKVHRRASTGIDWSLRHPVADILEHSIVKITGLWATWGLIAAIYGVFRFWWVNEIANFPYSMDLFRAAAIPLFILSVPYVIWLDRFLINQRDGAWHMGAWISGRKGWEAQEIFHHLRSWAVKGFFLAFMLSITPGGFRDIVDMNIGEVLRHPVVLANALITGMFLVDVQLATVGYLLTLKPLDAHIRTANPYMISWVAALMCYPPFILMNGGGPLDYHVATNDWSFWLDGHPILINIWGGALVVLTGIYAWATMAFGLRFSNLTHRGILTHGPYKWTRHPAYVSKNIFWWLSSLPFLVTNGSQVDAIRNTILCALVSAVYYWRAKTEEKHLSADPAYVEYSLWMERNAPIPRFFAAIKGIFVQRSGAQTPVIQPAE